MSFLTEMTRIQEEMHEADKKENPHLHWLTKDVYIRPEMLEMCHRCADHYKWSEKLQYDARTDAYYKIKKGSK